MKANLKPVADVAHRRRIPAAAIRRIVKQIVDQFSPHQVILFGSYARGTPRPESDVDLLVVMETPDEGGQSLIIRQAVPCEFGLDLLVRTPKTLAKRLKMGDFLLREIVEQGKILYASADR